MKRIYFDNCCYGRYLDKPRTRKIEQELEAIKYIMLLCNVDEDYVLFCSDVNYVEADNNVDEEKRRFYLTSLKKASSFIEISEKILERAKEFQQQGLDKFDARHLASAETECDLFFTVDDNFGTKARNIEGLNIKVFYPLYWIDKEQ